MRSFVIVTPLKNFQNILEKCYIKQMFSSAEADSPPDSAVIEDSPLLVSKKGILVNTETSQVVQNEG